MTDVPTTWEEDKIEELRAAIECSLRTVKLKDDMIEKLKSENEQLHLTISRLTEAQQKEKEREIVKMREYFAKRLSQLEAKNDFYTQVIQTHTKLGGK